MQVEIDDGNYQQLLKKLKSSHKVTKYINFLVSNNMNKVDALSHPTFTNDMEHSELLNELVPSKQIDSASHSLFVSGMYYHYQLENSQTDYNIQPNSFYKIVDSRNGTLILKLYKNK